MLAIQSNSKTGTHKCQPNVLPCRMRHNGSVGASNRYWNPKVQTDGSEISYFRGRKLHGEVMQIPDDYRGVILEKTDRIVEQPSPIEEEAEIDAEPKEGEDTVEDCRAMEEVASFENIMVWGHEVKADLDEDPYSKGINQWVKLAQAIHSYDEPVATSDGTSQ